MTTDAGAKPLVLVTGSSGLIGTRIIDALSARYRVVGLDVKGPEQGSRAADWIECDLTKDTSVTRTLTTVRERHGDRVASVIHLAAYYDFSGEPSPLYQNLTVEGTRRLLQGLQQLQVAQFVFSSSLLVMKSAEEDDLLTEASATEAEWDYPRSKLAAERVIQQERGPTPAVILRIAGVYDENCHSLPIAQHISRIYEKKIESYFFPGDKTHGQAFVHLDDLIACIGKVVDLRRELQQHELFLIAEPDVMSYEELQEQLGKYIHGHEWPTIRIPKAAAKVGAWAQEKLAGEEETFIKPWMVDLADQNYPVAIGRAQERLGWKPQHRLRDTLAEIVARLKRDPQRWYQTNGLPPPDEEQPREAGSAEAEKRA